MTYLFYMILITNYENKQGNKLTPEFGFVSNRRWEEQEKTKLPELTGAPEWTPSLAPVGFFTEVEAM